MTQYNVDEIRKQLIARGYKILPNQGKIPCIIGWNTPDYVRKELTDGPKGSVVERIMRWPRRFPDAQSTGVRVENGLVVIDADIYDGDMADRFMLEAIKLVPGLAKAPTRFGNGRSKRALFVRYADGEETFIRLASRKYEGNHCVEIFGGKPFKNGRCSRQFGVYGPHSHNDDGSVALEYIWSDHAKALHEVDLVDLPIITRLQISTLIDRFDALAKQANWKTIEQHDTSNASVIYDITEETRFDTSLGSCRISYDELCDEYAVHGEGLRCSSNFMPGRGSSGKTSRCIVGDANRHGCVAVYVFGDEVLHYPVQYAPRSNTSSPSQQQDSIVKPDRPADGAVLIDKAQWLLQCYGYHAISHTAVELFKPADDCQIRPVAFQQLYRSWHEEVTGPRGGTSYVYATSIWDMDASRINIDGVRMRPDKSFPLYQEDGYTFKNTYLRPHHEGSGAIQPWLDFMVHLLPVHAEREWFCNWLAHKHLNPAVPGAAVIMVAANAEGPVYGTGRGILRDIIARLLGTKYVRPIDFDVFTGKSAQGVYTDWAAYATLVTINEARDTGDSGRWNERRAVYERLKEVVDPRAIERTFTSKGQKAFQALAFASYLIASNNRDALQIPADDRRVAALVNGVKMSAEMASSLQAWMDQAGNIAELARWLEARDLSGFDVYTPPITKTKTVMQELARSELDDAWDTIRKMVGPTGLFTGEQILAAVQAEIGDRSSEDGVRQWVRRQVRANAVKVKDYRMTPKQGRHWIMCWRDCDQRLLTMTTEEAARSAVEATRKNLIGGATLEGLIIDLKPKV